MNYILKLTAPMRLLFSIALLSFLASCVTNRKTQYLQEVDDKDIPSYETVDSEYYLIQPGDELYIQITPFDPEMKESFSMETARNSYGNPEAMLNLQSYPVYKDGCIDYPHLGKIKMVGLTTREARSKMDSLLLGTIINDAEVVVKLVNNYVSVVGDVKRPGKFVIYKENLNIFQALAMAGDVATFGDRSQVKIIRHKPYETYVNTFDLRSDEILESEYYYVQPNDVIYVQRIKGQFFGMDSFTDFVALISGSLSILALSLTLWANNN